MTKAELIDKIYKTRGLPNGVTKKAVREIVDGVFGELGDYFVKTRVTRSGTPKFTYPGFGTFAKKKRAGRNGRNPQNGKPIKIPETTTLSFQANADLKQLMNGRNK